MQVNVFEAKNRLSELIKAAQAGEEVIIANRGEPVVRLVATNADSKPKCPIGSSQAILGWQKANPMPPYLQRSQAQLDQAIRDERDAWD